MKTSLPAARLVTLAVWMAAAFCLVPRAAAEGRSGEGRSVQAQGTTQEPALLLVRVIGMEGPQEEELEGFAFVLLDSLGAPIFRGRSGPGGEALIDLGALPGTIYDKDGLIAMTGEARQPGYQWISVKVRPATRSRSGGPIEHTASLLLAGVRGTTIRGVVTDAGGEPVPAEVSVREWLPGEGGERLALLGETWSDERGRFALHLKGAGTVQVLARSAWHGGAFLRDVELDGLVPMDEVSLTLRGAGSLRGELVDGAGSPVSHWPLAVVAADLDPSTGASSSFSAAESAAIVRGAGLPWATFRSDEQGRFELFGMQSGSYHVYADSNRSRGQRTRVTEDPVEADGSRIRLVFRRPLLAVSLLAPDGSPYQESDGGRASANGKDLYRWPKRPVLRVVEGVQHGGLGAPGSSFLKGELHAYGEFTFEGKPGQHYWVSVVGDPFKPSWTEVQMPEGGGRVAVDLKQAAGLSHGEMVVHVLEDGRDLAEQGYPFRDFDVFVEDVDTGIVLVQSREYSRDYPYTFRAPVGRYRVVARGKATDDNQHGTVISERVRGQAEALVELREDETLAVRLDLQDGGRLRLRLDGAAQPEDLAAIYRKSPQLLEGETPWGQDSHGVALVRAQSALVMLHRTGARHVPVIRLKRQEEPFLPGEFRTRYWALGEESLSCVLTAGTYTLTAELPGGRVARGEVAIVSGETAELLLHFPD